MQVALDILRLLFFPGLLFVALCGYILVFVEGRLHAVFYGGTAPRLRAIVEKGNGTGALSLGEIAAAAFSLAAMGLAGVLLAGARGDLYTLALLFSAVEILPLLLVSEAGAREALLVPLIFRGAFVRLGALFCVTVAVSLRFPGEFAAGMETFKREGAFSAIQLWSGADFAFILASLVCACIALAMVLMGRPACHEIMDTRDAGAPGKFYSLAAEGAGRAVALSFFVILFLGYPWVGWKGTLIWTGAVIGTIVFFIVARAWIEGRDRVTLAKWQGLALLAAVLSLALAFTAVA